MKQIIIIIVYNVHTYFEKYCTSAKYNCVVIKTDWLCFFKSIMLGLLEHQKLKIFVVV